MSHMSGGSDEEVGLRLATLFHVQDRDLLGDSGPTLGRQGQFSLFGDGYKRISFVFTLNDLFCFYLFLQMSNLISCITFILKIPSLPNILPLF